MEAGEMGHSEKIVLQQDSSLGSQDYFKWPGAEAHICKQHIWEGRGGFLGLAGQLLWSTDELQVQWEVLFKKNGGEAIEEDICQHLSSIYICTYVHTHKIPSIYQCSASFKDKLSYSVTNT